MSASVSSAASALTLGRFRIVRLLGKGSQSEVYLAHDPHLGRDVAIKTLRFANPSAQAVDIAPLLTEARTVSRFQHPNIVTLYDAGEQDGQPYLVFEYVDGPTLAQVLKRDGPLPAARVAELAVQILDALAYAHAQGIVHRDIKPSNILLGAQGMARVMDFGVAARIDHEHTKRGYLLGTPAYMAPEYIADENYSPRSDLFSCGMLLHELLTGRHAVRGRDVQEVMLRIVRDTIPAPSKGNAAVDERLDDILAKALKKDPSERYADASQMKNALELYLTPEAPELPAQDKPGADPKKSTLEFLLRRMRVKSDFPALSEAVNAINRIASSDKESVNQLSNSILKDFALTNKLLKLVNAAYYGHLGSGSISTISRAVVILGFDAVRSIALTLMLFDNLQNKGQAQQLKEEFVKVLYAGMLAREMSSKAQVKDAEEAFICAMFHKLGRMLSLFYFQEETEQIKKLIQTKGYSDEKAATQVLGLSFEELGIGIAKSWGFPDQLILSMKKMPEGPVKKAHSNADKLRVLAGFSNELCEMIISTPEAERGGALEQLGARYGESLAVSPKQLAALMEKSLQDISQFAAAVNVNLKQTQFARQASQWAGVETAPPPPPELQGAELDTHTALAATVLLDLAPAPDLNLNADGSKPPPSTEEIQAILTAGLKDISNSLIDDSISVNDILHMILEAMYTGMNFHRVLFCIKDARRNMMCGKFGFGDGVQDLIKGFQFALNAPPDVFHAALKNNADILISDIDDVKIAARIPRWFREQVRAHTFVIFPITVKGKPVGMIYADRPRAGEITIPEKELSLLKALRNQAVLAIKQTV